MIRKIYLFTITFFCLTLSVFAQTATVSGVVISEQGSYPVYNASVTIRDSQLSATTDSLGKFSISNVPYGSIILDIVWSNQSFSAPKMDVNKTAFEAGFISVAIATDAIPEVTFSDNELKESELSASGAVLSSSRDAFTSASIYTWSFARFRYRGYDMENYDAYINGAPMNDLVNGRIFYNTWGGLNSVTRNRDQTMGLGLSTFSFGGVGGAAIVSTEAAKQRKQFEISYSASNRTYDNRLMLTYSTGILKSGWAFSVSGSRRWADEGYVKGTYYDGWSYFASAEKIIHNKHFISLTTFGAPTKSGRQGPAVAEMFDLSGTHYYNPYWGYQNGEVRNSNVGNSFQPITILSYEGRLNSHSSINAAASFMSGHNNSTALDWYNAPDPRPDFYRNLPSFTDDSSTYYHQYYLMSHNESMRQINWDNLYNVNYYSYDSIPDANGIEGNTYTGKRSHYIIQDRVADTKKGSFNAWYNNSINDHINLTAGLSQIIEHTEFYERVNDLLGGEFYVDIDQYAERDFPDSIEAIQNDLNNPNRILYKGDKYGYDYIAHVTQSKGFIQSQFKFTEIDFFVGLQLCNTSFYREGLVRNGNFPESSYGDATKQQFFTYGLKGGFTFKLDGRNFIYVDGAYQTRAPFFDDAYISARTRNEVAPNLKEETIYALEGGYLLRTPRLKGKLIGYLTQFQDATRTTSFYHEDYRTFVNYTLTNIDTKRTGMEVSLDADLGKGVSATFAGSFSQYLYTDRPLGTVTQDNSPEILAENQTVYMENFHVAGGPEDVWTAGLNYRSPNFWSVYFNVNYFNNTWIDVNPARRTTQAVDLVEPGSTQWTEIIDQQHVGSEFTVDISASYSWKVNNKYKTLKKNTFLVFNLGITNLFNNTNLISSGFEQGRYDFTDKDPNKFPSKYYYSYGATFFASIALRLN